MNKLFKKIVLVISTGFLLSSSCKDVSSNSSVELGSDKFVTATITEKYSKDGCGFILTVQENGKTLLFDPVSLENKFKQEGMKVIVKFHISRVQQTSCFNAQPVIIDDIKAIRDDVVGYIRKTESGCGIYIETADSKERYYPVNLDSKFKQDGLKVSFSYNVSRAAQPKGCEVDYTISIVEIEEVK